MILILFSQTSFANEIYITQSGKNLTLDITQKGGNNTVKKAWSTSSLDGDDTDVKIVQEHNYGSSNNVIEFGAIDGDRNSVELRQGSDNLGGNGVRSDSVEYSGHYSHVGIVGDDNSVRVGQRNPNNSPHSSYIVVLGADGVEIEVTQGSSGSKDAEVWVRNDNSNISVLQHNNGAHEAYVSTTGSYASNLELEQKGSSQNSYSLTQQCMTVGGCSASVTQQ